MKQKIKSIVRPIIKTWVIASEKRSYPNFDVESPNAGNDAIKDIIIASKPASIGKIGSTELDMIRSYLQKTSVKSAKWNHRMNRLHVCSGIFPEEPEAIKDYCEAFLGALEDLDVLGIWFNLGEAKIAHRYCKQATIAHYCGIEPFDCDDPWSRQLEGKNVLVIHPFRDSIKKQYEKRDLVWAERRLLPTFNLHQIKMPLSDALVPSQFPSWKELLDDIKKQMDGIEYDIALIGAGGYSLLIAQHAKASGKIGIHLGGSTQMLFGVAGSRWLNNPASARLFNEHWIRPMPEEVPPATRCAQVKRDSCYW